MKSTPLGHDHYRPQRPVAARKSGGSDDMRFEYKSCATWPKGTFDSQDNYTEDYHFTESEAKGVCELLHKNGAGGDGVAFPLRTWTERIYLA